jgi:chemotaxis signal transduction protein
VSDQQALGQRAADLRRAFDASFAVPRVSEPAETEDLLGIRVAGEPYAIPLREITGIMALRTVVPIPVARPDVLGLAGIRGAIVPVFRLASLLGYGSASETSHWLILCDADEPIALAVAEFEGYLRLPKACLHRDDRQTSADDHVQQIARTSSGARAVLSIPHIVATIRARVAQPQGSA